MQREDLVNGVLKLSTEGTEEVERDLKKVEKASTKTYTQINKDASDSAHQAAQTIKEHTKGYRELIRAFEQVGWAAGKAFGAIGLAISIPLIAYRELNALAERQTQALRDQADYELQHLKTKERLGLLTQKEKDAELIKMREEGAMLDELEKKAETAFGRKSTEFKQEKIRIDFLRQALYTKHYEESANVKSLREDQQKASKDELDAMFSVLDNAEAIKKSYEEKGKEVERAYKEEIDWIRASQEAAAENAERTKELNREKLEALKKYNAELKKQSDLLDDIRSKQQEVFGITKGSDSFIGGQVSLERTNRLLRQIDNTIVNTQ